MAKLSLDLTPGVTFHPRESLFLSGTLGALNAELANLRADGAATVTLDLRGTLNMTIEVAGSVDGANWVPIPMRAVNQGSKRYIAAVSATVGGLWVGTCAGYRFVRARVTAYTSGAATTVLAVNTVPLDQTLEAAVTADIGTILGAVGAATTLTLASPGVGLRHYLTYLSINRFATALLTAAAVPVTVTTTNLPGTLALSFAADAAAQGTIDRWREDFSYPMAGVAQNAATTIVCPATPNVIWRVTAGFYVAP